ncbi:RNA-binding ribosome biosynthesis protein [Starmerella bacillaris]|uniref:RNA-binding ribosome biosynthesis protein n=1 Tax=Starmerella bacillaris TaxID=1247836 RepID=A0AAV5RIH9_STABA|nr:RNA-binding ribosome biosynthesis protein [Starmerella bacillaris]
MDLLEASRALGGTEEDIKLIGDVDFSGSEFEDDGKSSDKAGLREDVESLWKELSGGSVKQKPDNKKPKAKESRKQTESSNGATNDDSKSKLPPTGDAAKSKLNAKSNATKNEQDNASKTNKASTVKSKTTPKAHDSNKTPIIQMSKKTRLQWNEIISKLHADPTTLLLQSEIESEKEIFWADLCNTDGSTDVITPELIQMLESKSRALLFAENQAYYSIRSKERDFSNSLEFLKSGTFSDQLGTLSILATESPIHSIRFIDQLYSKCEIKNRESACKALEVFKDLIVSHILPDRRLKWFKDQPFSLKVDAKTLLAWSFEDYFKGVYFKLLQTLEKLLSDTVENIRLRALYCVFDLFQKKPEQEANLLRLGVNKFGDSSKKVSSKVKKLISDVLQQHPGMKSIVATAISDLLKRSNDYRVRYYAVDTLSEFIFSSSQPEVANQLLYIYLELFERLLGDLKNDDEERDVDAKPQSKSKRFRPKRGKKGGLKQSQLDESELEKQKLASLISKIFTGLNRAFPFSNIDAKVFAKYTNTLYHMSHSQNINTLIEALSFIFQLLKSEPEIGTDRYYRALYDSLYDQRLVSSSKFSKYVLLLLRSMAELKGDKEIDRSNAFAKRELQDACNWVDIGAAASMIYIAGKTLHFDNLLLAKETEDTVDFSKRDPRYVNASTSNAWELSLLQNHFHPTVALYASNLLSEEKQQLELPDIEQYSVNNFLSKWSYKKPKQRDYKKGASIFQTLPGFTDINLGMTQKVGDEQLPASMQDWKSRSADSVAPEEAFLFQYFKERPEKAKKASSDKATKAGDSDSDADSDELAEEEINEAMAKAGPGDQFMAGMDEDISLPSDDDSDDGDLEAGLAAAFNSSSDEAGSGDDLDEDSDIDGDMPELDMETFAEFDQEEEAKAESEPKKKRKREWTGMPTFLDADAFEDLYSKKQKKEVKHR